MSERSEREENNAIQSIVGMIFLVGVAMAMIGAGIIWGVGGVLLVPGAACIAWAISIEIPK